MVVVIFLCVALAVYLLNSVVMGFIELINETDTIERSDK